jgi:hypothetical protein
MPINRTFYYKPIIDFLKKKKNQTVTRNDLYKFIVENFGVKEPRKIVEKIKKMGYVVENIEISRTISLRDI